jgi:hypothetical protein
MQEETRFLLTTIYLLRKRIFVPNIGLLPKKPGFLVFLLIYIEQIKKPTNNLVGLEAIVSVAG